MERTRPSGSLIVNLRSPTTNTFADGRARVRARANSWVKAVGVSISAQMATQIATTENSTPKQSRMPRPYPRFNFCDQRRHEKMQHHRREYKNITGTELQAPTVKTEPRTQPATPGPRRS